MTDERLAEIQHRITKQKVTFNDVTELVQALRAERQKVAEIGQQMQWISVADRLPAIEIETNKTNMQIVNVVTSRGYVTTAKYSSEGYNKTQKGREPKWRELDELDCRLFFGEVTHWMPLPKRPIDIK